MGYSVYLVCRSSEEALARRYTYLLMRGVEYMENVIRRRGSLLCLLGLLVVLALSGCDAAGNTGASSTGCAEVPSGVFRGQLLYITADAGDLPLRGNYLNDGWDDERNLIYVNIIPNGKDLATIQWNAYQVQKYVWTSKCFRIDASMSVSVRQYVNGDANTDLLVGSADVSEAQGYALDWAHLSPQQVWEKYDDTTYQGG